ncbi:PH domain-containing protein [Candidatus Halobeggiatoa sp. HSG11]|nr:PH domain-containing protein [Candidatus Halobeggiatoa sp. HSG11]
MAEETLYDSAPAMFRNSPFWFTIYLIIPIVGWVVLFFWWPQVKQFWVVLGFVVPLFGLLPLLFWWLQVTNTRLTVSNERVAFRRGILSKNVREVFLSDIRSVEIDQSVVQRIMGTGRVEISSAASSDAEIIIDGIPDAYKVKKIIDEHRRRLKK